MSKTIQVLCLSALAVTVSLVGALPGEAAGRRQVVIQNRQFTPPELTVGVGEEVTWTNKDSPRVHSVTADDGSFDSSPDCSPGNPGACMDDRAQFSHVFPAEGRFPYYSRPHGGPGGQGTSGVIVVAPAGTTPPSTASRAVAGGEKIPPARSSRGVGLPINSSVSGTDTAPPS
jgi:plastocyanin